MYASRLCPSETLYDLRDDVIGAVLCDEHEFDESPNTLLTSRCCNSTVVSTTVSTTTQ